jgi:hypothetical protein
MGKWQGPNLQNCLLSAPNHRSVYDSRHGFVQIPAAMVEGSHEDASCQPLAQIALR